jgi:hypothetical protein
MLNLRKGKSKKAKVKRQKEYQWNRKLYLIDIPDNFCSGAPQKQTQ